MDARELTSLLKHQEDVVSRRQVIACGGTDNDIARKVRRREWKTVHPGVYVAHTGPLTREQAEWAAVLHYAPAALGGPSALRRYGIRTGSDHQAESEPATVHLVVGLGRRVEPPPGIELTRLKRFDEDVRENLSPPRLCLEQAVLEVSSAQDDEARAVAILCDAVQSRRTTPARLLDALSVRPRLRHRSLLRDILLDVVEGAYSVLERNYLRRVERPHGFPRGARQRHVRSGQAAAYRDVEYPRQDTVVELDGTLGHERARDRWKDLERDIASAATGSMTLRLGWGQVLAPCRTAAGVASVLVARGWEGSPSSCSPECDVSLLGGA